MIEDEHNIRPSNLRKNFTILKKCRSKLECLILEMLYIKRKDWNWTWFVRNFLFKFKYTLILLYHWDFIFSFSHLYFYIYFFTFYGYITNWQCDQLPDGLIAQSVEHCTGIAEVMGSKPFQALI